MVDLTLFHLYLGERYPMLDNLNRRTSRLACYFLEWTGWYNHDLAQRLLGHYRLYQLYKKDPDSRFRRMPLIDAYILHYRSSHNIKYFISKTVSFLYCIGTFGRHYLPVEIETFNRSFIYEHSRILREFLNYAEEDFTAAFFMTMEHLQKRLLDSSYVSHSNVNIHQQEHHHYEFRQEYHYHQVPSSPPIDPSEFSSPTGKTKGVFSKKQILIFFDLLSQTAHFEKIDLSKPNKYEALAELFQAITGRSKTSWLQELNDRKLKDLYAFQTQGELNQLIATLTNLAELFRKAGFRAIATLADKKIRELERHKNNE